MHADLFLMVGIVLAVQYTHATHTGRTLLILHRGNGNSFDNLWNSPISVNDPYGNRSLADVNEGQTDFRAVIDPAWGSISQLELLCFNNRGEDLASAVFEVAGENISTVNDWFTSSKLVGVSHFIVSDSMLNLVARDGNKELLVYAETNRVWFSVLTPTSGVIPTIVLAVNTSSALTKENVYMYDGCWPDWELTLTTSFTDTTNLTVKACSEFCNSTFVALQFGDTCHCAAFKSRTNALGHMCERNCTGDHTRPCGGSNAGYFSVYYLSNETASLDHLLPPTSYPLLTFNYSGGYIYTLNLSAEMFDIGWEEDLLYIDQISVNAINDSLEHMLFSIEYTNQIDWLYTTTFEDSQGNIYFDTDGSVISLGILAVKNIRILFESDVYTAEIKIYGPPASSYVSVPYLAVVGYFDSSSTSTSSYVTNTSTTTTTDLPTTDPANTTVPSTTDPSSTTVISSTDLPTTDPANTTAPSTTDPSSTTAISSTDLPTTDPAYTTVPSITDPSSTTAISSTDLPTTDPAYTTVPSTTDPSSTTAISSTDLPTTDPANTTAPSTTDPSSTTAISSTDLPATDPANTTAPSSTDSSSTTSTSDATASLVNETSTTSVDTIASTTISTDSSTSASVTNLNTNSSTTPTPAATTAVSLYAVFPNMSVLVNGSLYCPCNKTTNSTQTPNITSIYQNTNKTFEELIAELTLDADSLSKNTRRYNSAKDDRPSAATIGSIAAIMLVSVVSFIVFLDSARLISEMRKVKTNYRKLKKRLSRRSLRVESVDIQIQDLDTANNLPDILK